MNYFKQIIYEIRNQRMVTWVTISGTALAIFLIMLIFMGNRMGTVVMAPESNRSRILIGQGIHGKQEGRSGSSMSFPDELGRKIYGNLDGIEHTSFISVPDATADVSIADGKQISAYTMGVDDIYWKIYDYRFISGHAFEEVDVNTDNKLAILTESTARKIFRETDVTGRQFDLNNIPYVVKGVVKDSNPLLTDGNVEIFTNYNSGSPKDFYTWFGQTNVRLLAKEGTNPEFIKEQVKRRYEEINRENGPDEVNFIYHKQPYTLQDMSFGIAGSNIAGSNNDPSTEENDRVTAIIYFVLLLLPAINLSNMTRSRLMHRISEIGVRRAFGAKRISIISQIFTENLLLSFVGGAIGLILCVLFVLLFSMELLPVFDYSLRDISDIDIAGVMWHIFDFKTFLMAFGACFLLNVLSASVPAWKASAVEPAVAISKSK